MLTGHGDLELTIERYTDNVGNAATNQELSQRGAAAEGVPRREAWRRRPTQQRGLGNKKPASPNRTPEGRQHNRRVELVKM